MSDIYNPSYSALIDMIDLDSKELAAKFTLTCRLKLPLQTSLKI